MPPSDWANDESLFASLPGGQAIIDWFGFCPQFHDGHFEKLEIAGGDATLTVQGFRMTDHVDAAGFFVLDRRASVTLHMRGVSGVKLEGDAGSIISRLIIRRLDADAPASEWISCMGPASGDIEVTFDTSVGLYGSIFAKELEFEIQPQPNDGAS